MADWLRFLRARGVPMSPGLSDPLKLLVDDALVAGWVREGLPADPTSVQNGAILTSSGGRGCTARQARLCALAGRGLDERMDGTRGRALHPSSCCIQIPAAAVDEYWISPPAAPTPRVPIQQPSSRRPAPSHTAERWPLMLDPQLQGISWVKEREARRGLVCVRMGAPDMLRAMEKAMAEVGVWVAGQGRHGAGHALVGEMSFCGGWGRTLRADINVSFGCAFDSLRPYGLRCCCRARRCSLRTWGRRSMRCSPRSSRVQPSRRRAGRDQGVAAMQVSA